MIVSYDVATFGTDALLAALRSAECITDAEFADAWLQMARWRYRFLVPTPEVFLTLASRNAAFPPGDELRAVCRYLHDCSLDPGLFPEEAPTDGAEDATPGGFRGQVRKSIQGRLF
jgi:hypothetical protein